MPRTSRIRNLLIATTLLLGLGTSSLRAGQFPSPFSPGTNSRVSAAAANNRPTAAARLSELELREKYEKAILLMGYVDKHGRTRLLGTASVISKANGLAVTNSHVAEFITKHKLVAMVNGTREIFRVEKASFHPGVKRFLRTEPSMLVRAMDPHDGNTDAYSPDVAVLQLSKYSLNGKALPAEIPMATPAEVNSLQARPITIFGFPGSDTENWPGLGTVAAASFYRGYVSRVTMFDRQRSTNFARNQFVQHSNFSWGGSSGSPLILDNGHLAAIHNSGIPKRSRGFATKLAHGIRIDAVWELLAHHQLTHLVAMPAGVRVDVSAFRQEDPTYRRFKQAIQMVDEAKQLVVKKGRYQDAIKKCDDAMKFAGVFRFSYAHQVRALAKFHEAISLKKTLSTKDVLARLTNARTDAGLAKQFASSDSEFESDLVLALVSNEMGNVTGDAKNYSDALSATYAAESQLLSMTAADQALTIAARGTALFKGNLKDWKHKRSALSYFCEAIRLNPSDPTLYLARADYWKARGNSKWHQADVDNAARLQKELTAKL